MRVLLTAQPGWGHVQPVLSTARLLQRHGHEPLVATGARYIEAASRVGIEAVAAGLDWDLSEPTARFPHLEGLDAVATTVALRDIFLGTCVRPFFDDLAKVAAEFEPDAIVSETWEVAGPLLAEHRCVPARTLSVVTVALPASLPRPEVAEGFIAARQAVGLAPIDAATWAARQRSLFGMPPSWFLPGLQPGHEVELIRPPVLTDAGGTDLPEWLEHRPRRPLVLATLGTVFGDNAAILSRLIEAAAGEPYDLLIALGHRGRVNHDANVPENVHVEQYVPFSRLLPRCTAVVSHGGFGTVAASVAAGVPMVVMPIGADQFLTARQVERLGLGVVVTGAEPVEIGTGFMRGSYVNSATLTAAEVRQGIRRAIDDDQLLGAVLAQRNEIERIPADAAVRHIERAVAAGVDALVAAP